MLNNIKIKGEAGTRLALASALLMVFIGILSGSTASAQTTLPIFAAPCVNQVVSGSTITCDPSTDTTAFDTVSSAGSLTALSYASTGKVTVGVANENAACHPDTNATPIDILYLQQGIFSQFVDTLEGATYFDGGSETPICVGPYANFVSQGAITTGFIFPKAQVVGVVYAPPGNINKSDSSVMYSSSFTNGYTYSNTNSYTQTNSQTVSVGFNINIDVIGINASASTTTTVTQTNSTLNSIATTSTALENYGLQGSTTVDGIDHDFDRIAIWLNPAMQVAVLPDNTVVNLGLVADSSDIYGAPCLTPAGTVTYCMDVVYLPVSAIKQFAKGIPVSKVYPSGEGQLDRTWNTVIGALTQTEWGDILNADPFAENPYLDPASMGGRFSPALIKSTGPDGASPPTPVPNISYYPGGNQASQGYSVTNTATNTTTETATDTHSVSYSVALGLSYGFGGKGQSTNNTNPNGGSGSSGSGSSSPTGKISAGLKESSSYSYSNTTSTTNTNGTGNAAAYMIYNPLTADNYNGPNDFDAYVDNVYGTFVFYAPGYTGPSQPPPPAPVNIVPIIAPLLLN